MPRRPRVDRPGRLHHVMNRGIARRTVFETLADRRIFLALLARAVHEGRIELHAYVILTTHYHLLVRSLDGQLSETMRRVQNQYVRWFNRTRRRDGPLFRGRFRSIPVESTRYVHTLVRYIDQNPLEARLVTSAPDYADGSARYHSKTGHRPRWLSREVVDRFLGPLLAEGTSRTEAYRRVFAPRLDASLRAFVDRRVMHPDRSEELVEGLVATSSESVLSWMRRKAQLADATRPGLPLVLGEDVLRLVGLHRKRAPTAVVDIGIRRHLPVWDLAQVALLRDLAGETLPTTARRLGTQSHDVRRLYGDHRTALESDIGYRRIFVELARRLLQDDSVHLECMLPSKRATCSSLTRA